MVKLIINGCNGRMGQVLTNMAAEDPDLQVVAGIDPFGDAKNGYPVFPTFAECDVEADVIIDFSSPKAFDAMMDYAVEKQVAPVICTTGLSDEQLARVKAESEKVALLRSANMSLGINLLEKLLKQAVQTLADADFDVEIEERHHRMKKDAPSGTAIALADAVNEGANGRYTYVYDRHSRYEQRGKDELGISAVRGGTIVGDHTVIFAGTDEVIEFRHTAYSRAVFARGALQAAKYLKGKQAGFYTMSDVIEGN